MRGPIARGVSPSPTAGPIFLDEIGELDPSSQVKLLRVLQDRTYEVLGSSVTRSVDVRVVSATNRDLITTVGSGGFREDLLYRLNLITIRVPPSRERRSDIPLLAGHFLERAARKYDRDPVQLTDGAGQWLRAQSWPGNIRQLEQTVERGFSSAPARVWCRRTRRVGAPGACRRARGRRAS